MVYIKKKNFLNSNCNYQNGKNIQVTHLTAKISVSKTDHQCSIHWLLANVKLTQLAESQFSKLLVVGCRFKSGISLKWLKYASRSAMVLKETVNLPYLYMVGSIPTAGTKIMGCICLVLWIGHSVYHDNDYIMYVNDVELFMVFGFESRHPIKCSIRLMVRSYPFHGYSSGSNPGCCTKNMGH